MKKITIVIILLTSMYNANAQYNNLWIPDTLSGTVFNLMLQDTFAQFRPGNQTITAGINNSNFWGPTLIFQKGETVHMNVQNNLNDSTTLHWHGLHLPAVMDGGPHQVIPPNAVWQPYWEVKNNAATFWYHPHLHEMTTEQMTAGLGGFIIVRDPEEAALPLPRTYGVDDFPLAITDRRFQSNNQFDVTNYTDSLMVNGVLSPQLGVPAQVVRFRMLNTSPQRTYNLGFSDSRTFFVIASDGGLLDNPVPLTRYLLSPGERVEVLVDFGGQQNQTVDLKAYNSSLASDISGAPVTHPPTDALNGKNFNVLRFNILAPITDGITSIPSNLIKNVLIDPNSSNITRTITFVDGFLNGFPNTSFDGVQFKLNFINKTVPYNNTEIWKLVNNSNLAHSFHIHDVQFNVISRSGSTTTLQAYDKGWKDNILVRAGETLSFIAKFEDYSDATHPFMYHCHMSVHEDEGMMGQFVVANTSDVNSIEITDYQFSIYPNPSKEKIFVKFSDPNQSAYYIRITDALGRTMLMLPQPELNNGIDISTFTKGIYTIQLTDNNTKQTLSKTFIKE
ncbi:MAG: bilirubin oxidase [Ignavibacteriae bacterium HGW-Ignavibacteriae-4]|nr:MAG: bilirubin oxidase [Ignavibacteriae bacterium HGW-Ignavibacteriae-4]